MPSCWRLATNYCRTWKLKPGRSDFISIDLFVECIRCFTSFRHFLKSCFTAREWVLRKWVIWTFQSQFRITWSVIWPRINCFDACPPPLWKTIMHISWALRCQRSLALYDKLEHDIRPLQFYFTFSQPSNQAVCHHVITWSLIVVSFKQHECSNLLPR